MRSSKSNLETSQEEYLLESSVSDARWLFGFVMFSGLAVFAAGLIASMIAS